MHLVLDPSSVVPDSREVALVVAIVAAGPRRVVVWNVQAAIAEHSEKVGLLSADLIGELGDARGRVDLPDLRGAGVGRRPGVRAVPAPDENPPVVELHVPHIASV